VLQSLGGVKEVAPALTGGIDHCKGRSSDLGGTGRITRLLTATAALGAYRGFLTRLWCPFAAIACLTLSGLCRSAVASTGASTAVSVQFAAKHTAQKIGVGTAFCRATVAFNIHLVLLLCLILVNKKRVDYSQYMLFCRKMSKFCHNLIKRIILVIKIKRFFAYF
jgi:hypothetical protein